eukprot:2015889-Prymnesium_polylepis.1
MLGHERFLAGVSGVPYEAGSGPVAAVLTLGPLPAPVYKMFDCPDTACIVVACGPTGVDANAARGARSAPFLLAPAARALASKRPLPLARSLSLTRTRRVSPPQWRSRSYLRAAAAP